MTSANRIAALEEAVKKTKSFIRKNRKVYPASVIAQMQADLERNEAELAKLKEKVPRRKVGS